MCGRAVGGRDALQASRMVVWRRIRRGGLGRVRGIGRGRSVLGRRVRPVSGRRRRTRRVQLCRPCPGLGVDCSIVEWVGGVCGRDEGFGAELRGRRGSGEVGRGMRKRT